MVLGLGGTGKTSLIHRITGHPKADPRKKTRDFASYSVKHTLVDSKRSRDCHLTFDDYRGQNAGDLTKAINAMEVKPDYTAMVLLVDLFPAVGKISLPLKPTSAWDAERVRAHVKEWGDVAIDLVRGLAPTDFKYICLFINKFDLITPRTAESERAVMLAFGELIERLQARSAGVEFVVYVGSLTADIGTMSVAADLIRTASDVTPKRRSLLRMLAALLKTSPPVPGESQAPVAAPRVHS